MNRMKPPFIKAEMQASGHRPSLIAAKLQVTNSAVSRVILGKTKSFRIAFAISEATGLSLEQLWPGRYDARRAAILRGTSALRSTPAIVQQPCTGRTTGAAA